MLKHTFCHIPTISTNKEYKLWKSGIIDWEKLLAHNQNAVISNHIHNSFHSILNNDPSFFAENLPSRELWRIFKDFRHLAVYLDIETTGLTFPDGYITTIAIYDGKKVKYFINGDNIHQFPSVIKDYKVLITYNGKCFDVPFIERFFGIKLNLVHIDLRYLLKSLGYVGGLKVCEHKLGIKRDELAGIDGMFAVYLWKEYKRNKNKKALETLLSYNIQDVLNLEKLMVIAYNIKIGKTPFADIHRIPIPESNINPFKADKETIEKVREKYYTYGFRFY